MTTLQDYEPIVGTQVLAELKLLAEKLGKKIIQCINSTAVGGGVAEILNRIIPLLKELEVNAHWDVIKGEEQFFGITKKIHNAMHGRKENITPEEHDFFLETNRTNAKEMNLYGDIIFVHDPQPIAWIEKKKELGRKWLWRCHIDSSQPTPEVWDFLAPYVEQYDAAIFSAPAFARAIKTNQFLISPSIDPLSIKNKDLSREEVQKILEGFGIDTTRPILTQISRFDRLKDPVGVIDVYRLVKKYEDCQLILVGAFAADDPEGNEVLAEVREKAGKDPDIHILLLSMDDAELNALQINALQRGSTVVLQKSLREGFALTVAEALWKGTPVVASPVGGIPLQITHKYSGLLSSTIEGTAYNIRQLVHTPAYGKRLARNAKEHIRQNFLITRHLRDYLLLFLYMDHWNKEFIAL